MEESLMAKKGRKRISERRQAQNALALKRYPNMAPENSGELLVEISSTTEQVRREILVTTRVQVRSNWWGRKGKNRAVITRPHCPERVVTIEVPEKEIRLKNASLQAKNAKDQQRPAFIGSDWPIRAISDCIRSENARNHFPLNPSDSNELIIEIDGMRNYLWKVYRKRINQLPVVLRRVALEILHSDEFPLIRVERQKGKNLYFINLKLGKEISNFSIAQLHVFFRALQTWKRR